MSDAPAWTALGLSVVNTTWLGYRGVRDRKRRLAAGPAEDTRAALEAARAGFQHQVTVGGTTMDWFLKEPRPMPEQRLADLAKRTKDDRLAKLLDGVAQLCRTSFAHAPPKPGPRVYVSGSGPDPTYAREDAVIAKGRAAVVSAAREGLELAEAALDRLNELEAHL